MAWATAGLLLLALFSFVQSWISQGEIRRSYERSITPHLTWQDPRAEPMSNKNFEFWVEFGFTVRSVGPGEARLTGYEAKMATSGETFPIEGLVLPATLPVGAQYQWLISVPNTVERHLNVETPDREMRITLRYKDLQSLHEYETYAAFAAGPGRLKELTRAFLDVDERPANKRRIVPKIGRVKRWRRNVGGWIAGG